MHGSALAAFSRTSGWGFGGFSAPFARRETLRSVWHLREGLSREEGGWMGRGVNEGECCREGTTSERRYAGVKVVY